jgi:hypothetical protein
VSFEVEAVPVPRVVPVRVAGDAVIVLSRFLVSETAFEAAVLVAEAVERAVLAGVREAVVEVDDGVGLVAVFAGLLVLGGGFRMVLVAGVIVERRSEVEGGFATGDRDAVVGANEILLAAPPKDFFSPSVELVDGCERCPVAAVDVVPLPAGLRAADPGGGRVGGLLRLLVGAFDAAEGAALVAEEGATERRFPAVRGLLGGTVSFFAGGDAGLSFTPSSATSI